MLFSVTILGCSAALPTASRYSTAQLLQTAGRFFLVDCGEGTQIQLRRFGLSALRISHIFISHLHGDHVFGLPGLISTMNMNGRQDPLHLYGPGDLEPMVRQVLHYGNAPLFQLVFHVLPPSHDVIYEDKRMQITSFPLKHRIPTWGFRFQEKERLRNMRPGVQAYYKIPIRQLPLIKAGEDFVCEDGTVIPNQRLTVPGIRPRSYAFCSDTMFSESIVPYIRDVDLLYHEATYAQAEEKRAAEVFHATSAQAARIAGMANARRLVIGHFSAKYKDLKQLLADATAVFPQTVLAYDGLTISLPTER